ncbi:PAS domain-containing protein [Aestuariispira insulae]|uniref:PAS domain-containing protein n=1 Tax=Aestuariispira insulae TaxID=1461337 RepID=A0A3D9H6P7_9PROT|nr:PAS domain-containing protein [Aestuariispira insulae]RED45129.1 PAS domain-containing protein [Aestuariispira insulae]
MQDFFEPASHVGQRLLDHWHKMANGKALPARADLDPAHIPRLLSHLLLVDVRHDPLDFTYRLIGTGIVDRSAKDYTGMRVMDIPMQRPPSGIWSLYQAAVETGQPQCTHIPYKDESTRFVEMQALPLSCDGKRVTMLLGSVAFEQDEEMPMSVNAL